MTQYSQYNGRTKRALIREAFGVKNLDELFRRMYVDEKMSGPEISEKVEEVAGVKYGARSVQRRLENLGVLREVGDAFRNAAKKGRIKWQTKKIKRNRTCVPPKLRMEVMTRDNFRCVLCGCGADVQVLELDHIKPVMDGGKNTPENLRVLCYDCNKGKQAMNQEYGGGSMVSSKDD